MRVPLVSQLQGKHTHNRCLSESRGPILKLWVFDTWTVSPGTPAIFGHVGAAMQRAQGPGDVMHEVTVSQSHRWSETAVSITVMRDDNSSTTARGFF